ncbi:MAG: AbrB/MazE/SpoVT family DNA-binding domain-containing protein [Bacteroidota bacterium]
MERYGITDKVELVFKEGFLILNQVKKVREGWNAAFKKMAERGDDELLIEDVFEDENWEL